MSSAKETMRRLAVLVDSLDSETAGDFLGNVPTRTAETIRNYVVDLGKVSKSEREQVLRQFMFAVSGVQESITQAREQAIAEEVSEANQNRVRSVPPSALQGTRVGVERTKNHND